MGSQRLAEVLFKWIFGSLVHNWGDQNSQYQNLFIKTQVFIPNNNKKV